MKVLTKTCGLPSSIQMEGPHSLSWAYLLDLIFSHAYHDKIDNLRFFVGHPELTGEIALRAEITHTREQNERTAVAQLVTQESDEQLLNADVVYTVEYGWLSSRYQRKSNPEAPKGMVLAHQYSVFTWKARYFGIPIRLAAILNRPHSFDLFMKRMRRVFLTDRFVPSFYHLKIWIKSA